MTFSVQQLPKTNIEMTFSVQQIQKISQHVTQAQAALRKAMEEFPDLQGWTLSSTLDEYRLYAAPSPRLATEQFIELWDCDLLALPPDLPAWFERQRAMLDQDRARWRAFNAYGGTGSCRTFSSGSLFSAAELEGDGTAASTEMGTPSAHENIEAPLGADGSLLRVDGPLVLPGTVTSTVDRED